MKYNNDFLMIINDILLNENVQSLKNFKHHYGSTRFEHCLSVSYYSYCICKFLGLDYISAARAGLLHDLFFYDCESNVTRPERHLTSHPKIALENAKKLFYLNKKECDIILKHMWPITLCPPKYLESFIITFVDKYCALVEWLNYCNFCLLNYYALFYLHRKKIFFKDY